MRFAGKVWRLLVGIKDGLVLLFMLLFFGALYAALSVSPYPESATSGALRLDLSGAIVEQPAEPDLADVLAGGPLVRDYRLRDVTRALDAAATSDDIKAVALDLDIFTGGGQAAIANVADAIDRVKRAGKPVVAFATGYSDDTYHLASHASEIWLDPMGAVVVTGPGGNQLYFAGLLENLGVTANVYKAGEYKSAVEPFTRSNMSPEARRANQALADALWGEWLRDVAQARPKAQLQAWVNDPVEAMAGAPDMAQAALRAGLVDRLGDRTEFGKRMAELAGAGKEAVPGSYRAVDYDAWIGRHPAGDDAGRIGVLTVAGNIVDGTAGPGTAAAETVVENLERALEKRDLAALVVRIDSPGGSTLASERIRRAVEETKAKGIPVVISFGSVAASGGYWIATAGDTIFAEPSTVTGSIGVFGILPSFQGAIAKLGISADGVRTTPLSGEPDLLNGPSPEVDRLFQMGVDDTYGRFLRLVSESRKLPLPRVAEIAEGRVWDGGTARQLGLVDRFGSLDDAIAEAARLAKIDPDDAEPVWLEEEPGIWGTFLASLARGDQEAAPDAFSRLAGRPEALLRRALDEARFLLSGAAIQARCLDCPPSASPPPTRRGEGSMLGWLGALLGG